jgi:hypothetical protein
MTHDEPCCHPRVAGKPCAICATHYAPAEVARINSLADDYKRGLDKMVASGYEEFGIDVLRNHATVIKALRAYAKSKQVAPIASDRWTITSRRKLSERISWAWALLFRWPRVQRCGKETTMAKVIGWIAVFAFGIMIGAGIIYAASETVDTVADYREDH